MEKEWFIKNMNVIRGIRQASLPEGFFHPEEDFFYI